MKISYRPEIDGLRAVAVFAIILYHAKISIFGYHFFSGGFLGVDIFFVISGYLITSIIFKELVINGNFSFRNFYERRIRRILPALFFVIIASFPLAFIFLLPVNFLDYSKSILYSLGFSSNFYFYYSGQEYRADSGLLKPFLHTWSLSIEEQYYILFPIILLTIFKYFKKYLLFILLLIFLLSLFSANYFSKNNPSLSFYILPTRGWELIAGSLIAYFQTYVKNFFFNQILKKILITIGMLFIIYSVIIFNDEMIHPSFFTMIPVIGVCLVIYFSYKEEFIIKILSSKLFVSIGLISYSLYLWHYPIFAFARTTEIIQKDILGKIIVAIIIICLSVLTYFFIERPFRKKNFKFRNIFSVILLLLSIILTANFFSVFNNGKVNKKNIFIENIIKTSPYEEECKFRSDKINFTDDDRFLKKFIYCKNKFNNFILVIGDSHSAGLYNSISKISTKKFIIGLNKPGCRPASLYDTNCHYYNALKFVIKNSSVIDYVIFTHKGSYFLTKIRNDKQMGSSNRGLPIDNVQLKNTIDYVVELRKYTKVIFVGPHLEPNIKLNRTNIIKILHDKNEVTKISRINTDVDLNFVDKKLIDLLKIKNIKYISSIDTLDFSLEKDFLVDGNITFSDTDHWGSFGEIYFGTKLINNSFLKEILF